MAKKKVYGAQKMPPDGRVRRSQLLTTFGPGAMLDLLDEAVLIGGLDFWRPSEGGETIHEPRLRAAVADVMAQRKLPLSLDRPFRWPPKGDEENPNEGVGIQVYEFPQWFVCQNPKCRAVVKADQLERRSNHYWHACGGAERKEERSVPMRWVGSCKRGHLVDVDWPFWAHEREPCATPRLRLDEGSSGDFSEIYLRCNTCGRSRQLADFNLKDKAPYCNGARPWLGLEGREPEGCQEKLRLLTRTATNTYFSQTMSALSIPERPSVREAVRSQWSILQAATQDGLKHLRLIPAVATALGEASDEEVWQAIDDIRNDRVPPLKDIRTAELEQFVAQPVERPGEMPPGDPDPYFWAREHRPERLPPGLRRIVLARLLREVVTQIGFTRHEPATVDLQGRYDLGVEPAPLSLQRDWLPAVEIKGEGFFLELDENAVRAWESRPAVRERIKELEAGFGCLFVAECSCERFNQFLDRALVAPALGHEEIAFFGPGLVR